MSISTPVDSGTNTPATGSAASFTFNTGTTVPSGGKLCVAIGWFDGTVGATVSSVSGGGLTWTVESQLANGFEHAGFAWADCPSGLASGTTITINFSGTGASVHIESIMFTGAVTGAPSSKTSSSIATGPTWSSGTVATSNNGVLIGNAFAGEFSAMTNTPSGGNTEIHDVQISSDSASTTCYQFGTGASIAASGTYTTTYDAGAALAHTWDASAGTSDPTPVPRGPFPATRFGAF